MSSNVVRPTLYILSSTVIIIAYALIGFDEHSDFSEI